MLRLVQEKRKVNKNETRKTRHKQYANQGSKDMTIQAAIDARSTFPAILRELLEKHPQTGKRTTLKELGEAVGTRQQSISLYKNGDTQPSPDILIRIAAYFGVSVDYLLTGISSGEQSYS